MARLEAVGRLASWAIPAGACFVAFLMLVNDVSAEQGFGEIKVQGSWAYTTRAVKAGQSTWQASVQQKAAPGFYLHADPTSGSSSH
jgi:hypothetical protein